MGLYFQNGTGDTVWVAYAYNAPGCEGGVNWAKKGWYGIAPGGTAKVLTGWAGPGKYFFFATRVRGPAPSLRSCPQGPLTGVGQPGVRTAARLVWPKLRCRGGSWTTRYA